MKKSMTSEKSESHSIVINSLATISWLVVFDQNVPNDSRAVWKTFLYRATPADGK